MANQREVKYVDRDYSSLKNQLIDFAKTYFPDSYNDFSENSPSMGLLELAAYVGDVLSYYQDRNFNECFLDKATEFKNAVAISKNLGYRPRSYRPSYGKVDATVNFANAIQRQQYGFLLNKGTQISSNTDVPIIFETLYDIDFSKDDENTFTTLSAGKLYVTKKGLDVVSGRTKTFDVHVTDAQKFYKLTLPDKNVFNIVSVTDSNNNKFYEVSALSQDVIMTSVANANSSSADTAYNLLLKYVPRRYTFTLDGRGYPVLTFGSGINDVSEYDFIPSPEDYTINPNLIGKYETPIQNIAIENFLTTNSLGLAPSNTILTVTYTRGGGIESNVGANTINQVTLTKYQAKDSSLQNDTNMNRIIGSLQVTNTAETSGGDNGDAVSDIKYVAPKFFAAQGRAVTLQDFIAVAKSMPSNYGAIYRCNAKVNSHKNNTIDLYILSKKQNGDIINYQKVNWNMKMNLLNYLKTYRCVNDIVTINDAKIIDVGVEYAIRVDSSYSNVQEVLAKTLLALKRYFDTKYWDIEQSIYPAKISNIITNVPGVLAVYNLQIIQKPNGFEGRTYSTDYDLPLVNQGGKITCPANSIFQVRYPSYDLNGAFIID